jgi:WD40 repeat protein
MVHIWSLHTFPWSLVRTLSTSPTGKIYSLSWQHGTLYLAAAGINFVVMVWDLTNNWRSVTFASRSSKLPPPPNDSYVHYVDWSPAEPGNTKTDSSLIQPYMKSIQFHH